MKEDDVWINPLKYREFGINNDFIVLLAKNIYVRDIKYKNDEKQFKKDSEFRMRMFSERLGWGYENCKLFEEYLKLIDKKEENKLINYINKNNLNEDNIINKTVMLYKEMFKEHEINKNKIESKLNDIRKQCNYFLKRLDIKDCINNNEIYGYECRGENVNIKLGCIIRDNKIFVEDLKNNEKITLYAENDGKNKEEDEIKKEIMDILKETVNSIESDYRLKGNVNIESAVFKLKVEILKKYDYYPLEWGEREKRLLKGSYNNDKKAKLKRKLNKENNNKSRKVGRR
jgi:hypothetical protein